jgi:hypothetical protein
MRKFNETEAITVNCAIKQKNIFSIRIWVKFFRIWEVRIKMMSERKEKSDIELLYTLGNIPKHKSLLMLMVLVTGQQIGMLMVNYWRWEV